MKLQVIIYNTSIHSLSTRTHTHTHIRQIPQNGRKFTYPEQNTLNFRRVAPMPGVCFRTYRTRARLADSKLLSIVYESWTNTPGCSSGTSFAMTFIVDAVERLSEHSDDARVGIDLYISFFGFVKKTYNSCDGRRFLPNSVRDDGRTNGGRPPE